MNRTSKKRAGFIGIVTAGALVLASCGGGGGGSGSAADWCSLVRNYQENSDAMESTAESASPADMRAGMGEVKSAIERLERAAPAEIRGDATTIKNGVNDLIDALEMVDYNFFALFGNTEAMAKMESMDTPEFEAAGERLDDYTEEKCGFRIGTGESSTDFGSDMDLGFGDESDDDGGVGDIGEVDMSFLVPMYESLYGISTEQAECLVERTFGDDPFNADILSACGIDPESFGN